MPRVEQTYFLTPHLLRAFSRKQVAEAKELSDLADETGSSADSEGMVEQLNIKVILLALTGNFDAVRMITSGIAAFRSTGATCLAARCICHILRKSYASLGQFDEALALCWREAMKIETTKGNVVRGRRVNRFYRQANIELKSPQPDSSGKAEACFERALFTVSTSTTSKILGTPRSNEPRARLARPGQGAASARTARLRFTGGSPKGSIRAI